MIDIQEIDKKYLIAFQKFLEDIMEIERIRPFTDYLDAIHLWDFYTDLDDHITQYEKVYPDEVTDIFISNDIIDNKISCGSLWLFNENGCIEMKNFPNGNNMRFVRLKDSTYETESDDYKFYDCETLRDCLNKTGTNPNAHLRINVALLSGQEIQFKAVGRNCDFLFYILKKYIKA
ncbi:MAG: hypothetical protein ABSB21_04380 [Halobacteriota archaeon]